MKLQVNGPFEVKLNPESLSSVAENTGLGRMSLDKQFRGDLEAVSHGEMIAFRSSIQGSAGYVAMETVQGTLRGRQGSFVLQHSSTMSRGQPKQSITVVPDSGAGELLGLSGSMIINIDNGQHSYTFDFELPESPQ
ncbi:DUF3224 domain-containing protein [Burkholderia sp. BE17]|uniref:DUF3224 domain-containing protein n=1 Tax=Burkholderia sp. BE17 TaxID=2656644 RepID=UPI00128CA73C|nr:DUF3224 domain-containing protein [Burkholderia sp. BE17]MPV65379.1 DUF3224 family protein [Burkholderia sp. BE17]